MSDPGEQLIELVDSALGVSNDWEFKDWLNKAGESAAEAQKKIDKWQQFFVRAVDERKDPIADYYIQFFTRDASGTPQTVRDFDSKVSTYSGDSSYRCFHLNLSEIKPENLTNLAHHRLIRIATCHLLRLWKRENERRPTGQYYWKVGCGTGYHMASK